MTPAPLARLNESRKLISVHWRRELPGLVSYQRCVVLLLPPAIRFHPLPLWRGPLEHSSRGGPPQSGAVL